jgi:hypothetical protein
MKLDWFRGGRHTTTIMALIMFVMMVMMLMRGFA